MADIASQLSSWTFDKPVVAAHAQRSASAASSPNLSDDAPDTLRLDTAAAQAVTRKEGALFHQRYNSSEEDLTTGGSDSEYDDDGDDHGDDDLDDDVVVHDPINECQATTLSVSRWNKGRSCDMAVTVSYAFAGRPKVVEDCRSPLDRPAGQLRSASLAHASAPPMHTLHTAGKAQRQSMTLNAMSRLASSSTPRPGSPLAAEMQRPSATRPASPVAPEPRRPSTSYSPATTDLGAQPPAAAPPAPPASKTAASGRCPSPAWSEAARSTSAVHGLSSSRSSIRASAQSQLDLTRIHTTQTFSRQSYLAPDSPALSFLSSDPYENASIDASSPANKKPTGHRRLRSISFKLALAKIAIAPTKKSTDTRANNNRIPSTPLTPATPQTAPVDRPASFAAPNKLRRASTVLRPKSRQGESVRHSTQPVAPPMPQSSATMMPPRPSSRMIARGANEIEPTLVLPDFNFTHEDETRARAKSKTLRKRKSLMDFMDSLA